MTAMVSSMGRHPVALIAALLFASIGVVAKLPALLMASFVANTGLANITAAWHAYASRGKYIGWGTGSGQGVTSTDLATAANENRTDGTSS
jgi:hypothetical protein